MPIYSIEGPDKRVYEIEGPENASEQDLFTAAQRFMQQEQRRESREKTDAEVAAAEAQAAEARKAALAPTPEGGFKAATRAGLESLKGDIAGLAGRTGIVDTATAEKYKAEREAEARGIFQGTEDGWLESPWTKFKETAGGSLAYIAAPLIAGAGATLAGASAPVSLTAAGLASLAQFTGSNLTRQMEEKGLGLADTNLLAAGAAAVPQAALDVVSFKMLPGINRIFKSAGKELTEDQLKAIAQRNLLTNVGMGGAKVAGVEGLTEVGQQFLERLQADISTTDAEARDEYLESLIGGAVLGGAFGGVSGIGARGRARSKLGGIEAERTAAEEARAAAEQEAAAVTTPEGTAPAAPTDFLTSEEARVQKQRAGLERFGESAEFPSEISPTGAQTREERQLAVRDELDAASARPATAPMQGDLFLDAAQRARAEGAPITEQQRLMDVGAVPTTAAPAPAPVQDLFDAQGRRLEPGSALQAYDAYGAPVTPSATTPAGQGALPLVGGRTQEQQIIEMYAADQNAQAVTNARAKQAERVAQGEAGAVAAQQERLKFESDLAETDARLQQTRERTSEDNRLSLLLPLVGNPTISNIPKAFGRALQTAGFTDTQFTPRERELIQRAYDVRVAEDVRTPEGNVAERRYGTPNEMDVYKPARAQEPQQIGLPGFAAPKGTRPAAPEPEVAETPEKAVVGQDQVDFLYLPAASAVRKNILGKDVADPEQRAYVAGQLKAARDAFAGKPDPRSRTAVKRINDILSQSPFVRTQGEMFGPRGGVLPQPKSPVQGAQNANQRPTPKPPAESRASKPPVAVARPSGTTGAPVSGSAAGVSEAGQRRLADIGRGTKSDTAGAKGKPAAVKKETPKAAEKKVEPKAEKPKAPVNPITSLVQQTQAAIDKAPKKAVAEAAPVAAKGKPVSAFDAPIDGSVKPLPKDEKFDPLINTESDKITPALSDAVEKLLRASDLTGALRAYAKETKGVAGRIAMLLSSVLGTTKVFVVSDAQLTKLIKDRTGLDAPDTKGAYFHQGNEIFINADIGLNGHSLLHEAVHAATKRALSNPNNPVTKQLTKLFDDVKDKLGKAYGASSLDEFVAEAFGNMEFRTELDTITPSGQRISALARFGNIIGNMLRRLVGAQPKALGSVMNETDRLIASIISPAPDAVLGMGYEPVAFLNAAGKVNKALPAFTERTVDNFHKAFTSSVPDKIKNLLRMSLPSNALEDIAVKYLPEAPEYEKLINARSGAEQKLTKAVNASLTRAEQWAAKQPQAKITNFNDVVNSSTLKQVDPSKPISAYAEDAEKLKAWKELQPKWNALGADGQKMYTDLRDSYKTLYDKIADLLKVKMDGEMGSAGAAKAVNDALRKIMDNAGKIEPYFPLTRMGDFWLEYTALAPDGKSTEKYVEAFETPRARARAMEELKKDPSAKNITPFAKPTMKTYRNAPSGSFMSSVLQTLELNKVSDTATEEIMNLFLNVMPETAFAQSFRQREGVLGFNADAISAMRLRTPAIGRQLVNLEYGAKLSRLNSRMQETAKASRDDTAKAFAAEYDKRIQLANSPDNPAWSQVTKTFAFGMTLGFNVSSALVNLTQVPLVVMPYLGGKYGYGDTASALARASRVFMGSGLSRTDKDLLGQDTEARAAPSLENIDFSKAPAKMKHYATLARIAGDNGVFGRSLTQDILNVDGSVPLLDKVNAVSGFVFHHGERMNRQIGMIATYDLELKRMETKPTAAEKGMSRAEREEAAATNAINMTNLLNGSSSTAGAPRIAQNALGSVALMYKRYGVSMYYMMFKTAREALKSQDAEVRHAAMRQIGGIFGSAALIAGVRGVPMFGVAALLYDMAKDDDEDDFRTVVNKWVGATAYSGGLNAITGLEIGSRVGLSDLLFRDNNSKPDQSTILSMVEMLGGPALGIALRAERGIKMINDGEVSRGVEQMLPAAFGNGLKALRYASEGATTVRGDPIMDEVSPWNVAGQAFGFAPAEYTRQLEINANEKGKDRATTETRTKLLRKFYTATRLGDSSEAQDVMEDIVKFNSKHPTIAITGTTIRDSMKKHAQTSTMMQKGVVYNKKRYSDVMQSLSEFNED
jgi:hypothetical protein